MNTNPYRFISRADKTKNRLSHFSRKAFLKREGEALLPPDFFSRKPSTWAALIVARREEQHEQQRQLPR